MTEEEKGIKRLDKTTYYIVDKKLHVFWLTDQNGVDHYQDHYTVVYKQKEKVKLGNFTLPYRIRYGINVYATYAGNRKWWFSSPGIVARNEEVMMIAVFNNTQGNCPTFKFADHKDRIL